jgi:hypothetical protein
VVQQTGDTHTLLLATREDILPHLSRVPATFTLGDVAKFALLQNGLEFALAASGVFHVHFGVGVDDLVT